MNKHANDRSNDRVIIFDTTLRDGEQAPGCSMTLREKLRVAASLSLMVNIWAFPYRLAGYRHDQQRHQCTAIL